MSEHEPGNTTAAPDAPAAMPAPAGPTGSATIPATGAAGTPGSANESAAPNQFAAAATPAAPAAPDPLDLASLIPADVLREDAKSGKQGLIRGRGMAWAIVALLFVLLVVCFFGSFAFGKYSLSLDETFQIISHCLFGTEATYPNSSQTVFLQIRLPRLVTCIMAGAALAVSGAVYQAIFKNPMVSPDLLGASSGSALGACAGILMGLSFAKIHLVAFACGLLAVGLTMSISSAVSRKQNSIITIILTGMVVSALFEAGVSISQTLADPDTELATITFWLMGSMTKLTFANLPILIIPVCIGLVPIMLLRYRLNVLSFGDEEAKTLGLNVRALRLVFILSSTLVTSATVACCGMVGWIGLVIPHLLRIVLGPDYRLLVPASIAGGALFLLLVDNITRVFCQVEISIGILTALVGAPFFLVLLLRGRKGWV